MESEEIDFTLGFNNISDIDYTKYEKDFTIIVDERKYSTPRIVADILSPKIRNLHLIDETINEYHIKTSTNTNQITDKIDYFSEFLQLCNFNQNHLDEERRERYSTYFLKLGNVNEYFKLQKVNIDTLTPAKAVQYLEYQEQLCLEHSDFFSIPSENNQEYITYISSHFYDISIDQLLKLSHDTVSEIICSQSLLIKDEDSLLDIVIKLYENDHSYSNLFSNILFFNLKYESIENFIKTFSIEFIDNEIWHSICDYLLYTKRREEHPKEKSRYLYDVRHDRSYNEFKQENGKEFEGIMKYLTSKTGGNIHDNGTIEITSNTFSGGNHPKNSVDYGNHKNYYASRDGPLANICFDFKESRVQLSDYSIKSANRGKNMEHLRSWIIEVSNDGQNFEEIDRHTDDQTLNEGGRIGTFNVAKKSNEFYRFVRISQTGSGWWGYPNSNHNQIYIQFIEFFGKLEEKNSNSIE